MAKLIPFPPERMHAVHAQETEDFWSHVSKDLERMRAERAAKEFTRRQSKAR